MNDKDTFAVWIASSMLRAHGDEFGAAVLSDIAQRSQTPTALDEALADATTNARRPGDIGLEFLGPLLPVILVEFGRRLWDAYAKALVSDTGKALAKISVDKLKAFLKRALSQKDPSAVTLADIEQTLREAAERAGLDRARSQELVERLYSVEVMRELTAD